MYTNPTCTGIAAATTSISTLSTCSPTAVPISTLAGNLYGYSGILCPASSSSSSSCFAGTETVMMETGEIKAISEVQVGDRILTSGSVGETAFAAVISVPHGDNDLFAVFSHIASVHHDIKMTSDHLVFAGECNTKLSLVRAGDVEPGACVMTVDGQEKVVTNELVKASGIYTVVTEKEFIVVNGVVASPFAVNHFVGNGFYGLHRLFYTMLPSLLKSQWTIKTFEIFANVVMFF